MTLLAPISAAIAAGLTLPTLIAFYLLKLRRRPVRVSSIALWDAAAQDLQVNVPFRWVRPSWLLLLHLLTLLTLLAALGRPALEAGGTAPERVFLLVDRSASMRAPAGDAGTRLDAAIERATELVDRLARGGLDGEAVVIAYAAQAVTLTPPTSNPRELRAALRSIEPTDEPGNLASALELVDALAGSGASEEQAPAPARAVLFSDGSGLPPEGLTLADASLTFEPIGADADPDAEPNATLNTGVVAFSARRDYDNPLVARVFARIAHTGTQPRDVPVTLLVDGRPTGTRAARCPGRAPDGTPGDGGVAFTIDAPDGALLTVRLPGSDALESDNRAHAWLPPPRRASILLVNDGSAPDVVGTVVEDVLAALDPSRLDRAAIDAFDASSASATGRYDLIVFDRVEPRAAPPVPSLHFGGGVPSVGLRLTEPPEPVPSGVASWNRAEPVLRDVSLGRVRVARPLSIALDEGADPARITTLATGADGPLIVRSTLGGTTRLVLAFDPAQSNWPVEVSFTIFLANAVEQLTGLGDGAAARGHRTGEPVDVRLGVATERLTLIGPDGWARELAGSGDDAGTRRIGALPLAGIYRFPALPGSAPICVSVLSTAETDLIAQPSVRVSGAEVLGGGAGAGVGPREIWHWFVLAGAALLVLEWLIYGSRSRV